MTEIIDGALATAGKPCDPSKYLEKLEEWYEHTNLLADSIGVKDKAQKLRITLLNKVDESSRFDRIDGIFNPRPQNYKHYVFFLSVLQIDFRYDDSTIRSTSRLDSTEFPTHLPTTKHYAFFSSCKSTSGMTTRQQGRRVVSIRPNRRNFQPTSPLLNITRFFLSVLQIDFRYDDSTTRSTSRLDSIESTDFSTHLPTTKHYAFFSKCPANRLPA